MHKVLSSFSIVATIAIALLALKQSAPATTLRYTYQGQVKNVVFGTQLANCVSSPCLITVTAVGDSATAGTFPVQCLGTPPCPFKGTGGGGFWNRMLTNITVSIYDPIAGVTYGPATLPSGFFVAFDNFNGGIGFGADGFGGPAYPVSIEFPGGVFAYDYFGLSSTYDLTTPVLVGGIFDNCPAAGLPCLNTPLPTIPVTLADGSTVQLSVPTQVGILGQFWAEAEPDTNQWNAVASMQQARSGHTATVLANGKVLVVGGAGSAAASSAEIYDPSQNSWTLTASPSCGRTSHAATLLADGRVLVTGGTVCPQTAEIFDPVAQIWVTAASIPIAYPGPTVSLLLQDHRVLVAGANGADVYDPVANTWTATSGLAALSNPAGALLSNGSAIILDNNCGSGVTTPQSFNPATNTWTAGATLTACSVLNPTATTMAAGTVLVTGSASETWWSFYDPVANSWGGIPLYSGFVLDPYTLPTQGSAAQLLSDGRLLLVGGNALIGQSDTLNTLSVPASISPIYDPADGSWTPKPPLNVGRTGPAVVMLQNGTVLAIGGQGVAPASGALASVEQFGTGALSQTITLGAVPSVVFGGTGTLAATASSGLPVSFASTTPQICSVSGNIVTGLAAGTCSITASQAGSASYLAAPPVVFSFSIAPAPQVISFNALPSSMQVFGSLTLTATASSGLPVLFSSATPNICTIVGAMLNAIASGTCTVVATQSGNTNVLPAAPVAQSLTVLKAAQTIAFSMIRHLREHVPIPLNVVASSGLPVSLASETPRICNVIGNVLFFSGHEGTCTITANQAGNAQYLAAPEVIRNIRVDD
jgi:hypothetical protein